MHFLSSPSQLLGDGEAYALPLVAFIVVCSRQDIAMLTEIWPLKLAEVASELSLTDTGALPSGRKNDGREFGPWPLGNEKASVKVVRRFSNLDPANS